MSKALAIFRDLRYRIKHFLTDTSDQYDTRGRHRQLASRQSHNFTAVTVNDMMKKPMITQLLLCTCCFLHSIITVLKIHWIDLVYSETGTECQNLDKKINFTSITSTVWPKEPFSRRNYEPEDVFCYQRITIRIPNVPLYWYVTFCTKTYTLKNQTRLYDPDCAVHFFRFWLVILSF